MTPLLREYRTLWLPQCGQGYFDARKATFQRRKPQWKNQYNWTMPRLPGPWVLGTWL